jgi:hypothetical protein
VLITDVRYVDSYVFLDIGDVEEIAAVLRNEAVDQCDLRTQADKPSSGR